MACSGSLYLPLGSKSNDSSQKNGVDTVYAYMYICMYVVYKYTHECMAHACLCIYVHVYSYICIWYLCMNVCVGLWIWVCIVFLYVQVHMCRGRTGWEDTVHRIRYFLVPDLGTKSFFFGKVFKMFLNFSNLPYQLCN